MKIFFLFVMFIPNSLIWAVAKEKTISVPAIPDRVAKYFEIGKTDVPPIYTQTIHYESLPDSKLSSKSVAKDAKGNVVFTETLISKGHEPVSQIAEVQQTKRHLELEVKEGQVIMRTRSLGPEKTEDPEEATEKLPANLISGALAEAFIIEHYDELMADETISAKMAIMEIKDLVSFKFFKKEMSKYKGRDVMVVAMKPSSIFIALIVDTIYLSIDVKEKKMIHYVGRTPLWKETEGKLKALDAEIVFD